MMDLAIQLYRVDNPDGIWEYEDEAMRLHYRKRALEEGPMPLSTAEPAARQQRPLSREPQLIKSGAKGRWQYAHDK